MIHPTARIHPSALIEEGAVIHEQVEIGPFCWVGAEVEIGRGTHLLSHVVLKGITKIGEDNKIYQFTSIGEVCQDLKYNGELTRVCIGDRNDIREYVSIHRGTEQGEQQTLIGNDNLFMTGVHVAHDCIIGNHCIAATQVGIAGHVRMGDYVILGGQSGIHQFCCLGDHAMLGGGSALVQDIPPYFIAQGNHASPYGVNVVGLKRRGFSRENIQTIRTVYKMIYDQYDQLNEAKQAIQKQAQQHPELIPFLTFFEQSQRGIVR